jgi:hypothetical protein
MYKILGVTLILIFLPVCVSFGDPSQGQGFLFDADNGVVLAGGQLGSAHNTNLAIVSQNQSISDPYHLTKAIQFEKGMLIQGAFAIGMDGLFGVGQAGNAIGGQLQALDGGLGVQDQFLNAQFGQEVLKMGGIGAALGIQGFIGVQGQIIISPHGANTNVQYLGLGIADGIGGGP